MTELKQCLQTVDVFYESKQSVKVRRRFPACYRGLFDVYVNCHNKAGVLEKSQMKQLCICVSMCILQYFSFYLSLV